MRLKKIADLQEEIRRLRATLRAVCEDAFADECPKHCMCDTYGHAEECGAVSAATHAKNLKADLAAHRAVIRELAALAVIAFPRVGSCPSCLKRLEILSGLARTEGRG